MKSKRWKLMSSALALSIFLTLSPVPAHAKWESNSKGYWWSEGSSYAKSTWKKIGSQWYYFGSDGYMVTGWKKLGSVWFYFNAKGQMQTGWQRIGGTWYYFASNGHMATDWQQINRVWFYFGSNGKMVTGWQKINGSWFYFESNGHMKTGWLKDGSAWYFLNANGKMAANTWINNTYYVGSNGAMLTNTTTPDGYTVGNNGKWDGKASTYTLFNTYSYFFHEYANALASVTFKTDGTFSGSYKADYLNQTGKICEFYGKVSAPVKVDEYTYKIKLEYIKDVGKVGEIVKENGSRYKRTERSYLPNTTYLYLYLPGCPKSKIMYFSAIGFQSEVSTPNNRLAPDTAALVSDDTSGFACVIH